MTRWLKRAVCALIMSAAWGQARAAVICLDAGGRDAGCQYFQNSSGVATPTSPFTPLPVTTAPSTRTIVPLDISAVTTAGTAVTALSAGHAAAGGFLVTSNAAGLCVNQVGAAGTATSGNTTCVAQNQMYSLVPSGNAVSVNSAASSVAIGGEGLN
jgi:hypothetical protein